jgi:nucleotide-binding universal stress UspA family protein
MFKRILIATDGSELSRVAVDKGLRLAKALGAEVTAVTVTPSWVSLAPAEAAMAFPVEEYVRATNESAQAILSPVAEAAKQAGVTCIVRHEPDQLPAQGILAAAEAMGSDLIVMASHGRRGLKRLLLGSQANEVLTHSKIPVLIVR